MRVGFIGTGLMGAPMAGHLVRAGHAVTVWNRSPAKAAAVPGATLTETPAGALRGAEAAVVMLSSGPVCDAVLFGPEGAAAALAPGALLAVMSSVAVEEAEAMAAKAAALGLRWIDAPVSGGEAGAKGATLSIMAGGRAEDIAAAAPVLSAMGTVHAIGPAGTGAMAKLVNQLAVASTLAAVAEALILAEAGGADPAKVRAALMGGFASSAVMEAHGARMVAGDFAPGGPAKYQLKDTRAALALAARLGLDLPVLRLADGLFEGLVTAGGGDLDHSAIFLELKRRNGRLPQGSPLAA